MFQDFWNSGSFQVPGWGWYSRFFAQPLGTLPFLWSVELRWCVSRAPHRAAPARVGAACWRGAAQALGSQSRVSGLESPRSNESIGVVQQQGQREEGPEQSSPWAFIPLQTLCPPSAPSARALHTPFGPMGMLAQGCPAPSRSVQDSFPVSSTGCFVILLSWLIAAADGVCGLAGSLSSAVRWFWGPCFD